MFSPITVRALTQRVQRAVAPQKLRSRHQRCSLINPDGSVSRSGLNLLVLAHELGCIAPHERLAHAEGDQVDAEEPYQTRSAAAHRAEATLHQTLPVPAAVPDAILSRLEKLEAMAKTHQVVLQAIQDSIGAWDQVSTALDSRLQALEDVLQQAQAEASSNEEVADIEEQAPAPESNLSAEEVAKLLKAHSIEHRMYPNSDGTWRFDTQKTVSRDTRAVRLGVKGTQGWSARDAVGFGLYRLVCELVKRERYGECSPEDAGLLDSLRDHQRLYQRLDPLTPIRRPPQKRRKR